MFRSLLLSLSLVSLILFGIEHGFLCLCIHALNTDQTIKSFCLGDRFGCATFGNNSTKCWGYGLHFGSGPELIGDTMDELGNNLPFIDVGTDVKTENIFCGAEDLCVLTLSGDMKCVGSNLYGQTGVGSTKMWIGSTTGYIGNSLPFINVGKGMKIFDVAVGNGHTCTKVTYNRVKCFGRNDYGQLGQGNYVSIGKSPFQMGNHLTLVNLGNGIGVNSIHSGPASFHTCAILSEPVSLAQRLKCWGHNTGYQLGYDDNKNRGDNLNEMGDDLPLVDLGIESRVKQLSLGASYTCALLQNNDLKCFGTGLSGQLGSGSTKPLKTTGDILPVVPIDDGMIIALFVAGNNHNCLVYDDYLRLKCFGSNYYGQLGLGDRSNRGDTPATTIPKISFVNLGTNSLKIKSIHLGIGATCVVFIDSSVKCFGDNSDGQCASGGNRYIGDEQVETGTNLRFAMFFSIISTKAPSYAPTFAPIHHSTHAPSSRIADTLAPATTANMTASPTTEMNTTTQSPTVVITTNAPSSAIKCVYTTSADCKADQRCIWKGEGSSGSCKFLDCSIRSKIKCLERKGKCRWNNVTFECEPKRE